MTDRAPRVSILLCAYNSENFLRETLESALAQSFADFELLITDDCSRDSTGAILSEFEKRDARIRVFRNPQNMGTGYSFNYLLSEVRGDYVAQLGHDDVWAPKFLATLVERLENASASTAAVFCRSDFIDRDGQSITGPAGLFRPQEIQLGSRKDLFLKFWPGNFVCAAASLFRFQLLDPAVKEIRTDYYQDWLCWLHLLLRGEFVFTDETLVHYRVHGGNLSFNTPSPKQRELERFRVMLSVLRASHFATFLLAAPDPDQTLREILRVYFQSAQTWRHEDYSGLLAALRCNEMSLLKIPAFREIMTLLLWESGSFNESRRYGEFAAIRARWPELEALWRTHLLLLLPGRGSWGKMRKISLRKSNFPRLCVVPAWRGGHDKNLEWMFKFATKGARSFFWLFLKQAGRRLT